MIGKKNLRLIIINGLKIITLAESILIDSGVWIFLLLIMATMILLIAVVMKHKIISLY